MGTTACILKGLLGSALLVSSILQAGAVPVSLDQVLSSETVNLTGLQAHFGSRAKVTVLVNTVDSAQLEYYGMGLFTYELQGGHVDYLWSREDYANGYFSAGSERTLQVPHYWNDFGLGLVLATVQNGILIHLSPEPGVFAFHQGNGGELTVDGHDYRWDANSYVISINTPGVSGPGNNLVLHVAVPDGGPGVIAALITFGGLFAAARFWRSRQRDQRLSSR